MENLNKFKKGDIVGRISYNKDVLFEITKIIKTSNNKEIMILKGITERIVADSPKEDLVLMDKRVVEERIQKLEYKMSNRIEQCLKDSKYCFCNVKNVFSWKRENRGIRTINTGKILHLDGDRRYAEKSIKYYKSLGLNAIVKNIPENKQAYLIKKLLDRYNPDVLVLTRTWWNDKKTNRIQWYLQL